MRDGIIWCPHCGRPHKLGEAFCPTTDKPLEQRVHEPARDKALVGTHPLVGTVLDGRYEIVKRLGRGGMGEVFEAKNLSLGNRVAIKILTKATDSAAARLRHEASIIASIDHPNICDLYDVGSMPDGSPYIVLELLKGETLGALIQRGRRLAPKVAVEVFSHILSGVHVAHTAGIIHRDLKPANVFLVDRVGCVPAIKVLDFGFAKDVTGRFKAMTKPGLACGTPAYMSPEQLRTTPLDLRSDLFSIGLMLFEAVTGQHPFAAASVTEVCINILREPAPTMRELRPRVPTALDAVVFRALQKTPTLRYPSALAMQTALIESVEGDDDDAVGSSESLPRLMDLLPDSSTSVH